MASTWPIAPPQPTTITEAGWPNGALIKNMGSATAYAADKPGRQVDGFPIDPNGGTLSWDAHRPLYITASAPTTVVIDENSASTVSSPRDIASALITTGQLPQLIAQQLEVTGIPPIDNPGTLVSTSRIMISTDAPSVNLGTGIDVSRYNSIAFHATALNVGTAAYATDINSLVIDMGMSVNGFQAMSSLSVEGNSTCSISGVMPVSGSVMNVTLNLFSTNYIYSCYVVGSYKTVPHAQFTVTNGQWSVPQIPNATGWIVDKMGQSRYTDAMLTVPAASGTTQATATYYPSYCSGPITYTQQLSATPAKTVDMYMQTPSGLALVAGQYGVTSNALLTYPALNTGGRQPVIRVNNQNTTAITARFALGGSYN